MEKSRVLVVTLLTTVIWLLVTFLTPNQNTEVRLKMFANIGKQNVIYETICNCNKFGDFVFGNCCDELELDVEIG